jgi:hypothetical protein
MDNGRHVHGPWEHARLTTEQREIGIDLLRDCATAMAMIRN